MWYLYTMEFYSATKKNEILSLSKWIALDYIILNEVSQAQKAKNCISPSYADYRSKTNAVILLYREREGKERKPKLAEATLGKGQGSSEEVWKR
jgi:hypothetical protein